MISIKQAAHGKETTGVLRARPVAAEASDDEDETANNDESDGRSTDESVCCDEVGDVQELKGVLVRQEPDADRQQNSADNLLTIRNQMPIARRTAPTI